MTKTMKIEGMSCGHCVKAATKALEGVAGVKGVTVSLEEKSAVIVADEGVTNEALTSAIVEEGYQVVSIS